MTDGMKKGLAVSFFMHILICAALGSATLNARFPEPRDVIYDVALMGASGSPAAAPQAQAPPKETAVPKEVPVPEEKTPPPEETVHPPRPDDIIEEKTVEQPVPQPTQRQAAETPQPAAAPSPRTESVAPGGTGSGGSGGGDGGGSGSKGDGGAGGPGDGQGLPPAGDAIEAPAVPPRVTASRPPEYPSSARSKGIEGRVLIRFTIDKEGEVVEAEIAESSGNDALDEAALRAAAGFSFNPGLDGYGRPVRCYAYQPFTFRLH